MPHDVMSYFRELGSPLELHRLSLASTPQVIPNNAHVHLPPNFSAFASAAQAVELAAAQNCAIIGASNYHDYRVYTGLAAEARRQNVFPLFGMEIICMLDDLRIAGIKINDPANPGKMYICGKGIVKFDQMSPEAQRILAEIRENDTQRTTRMIDQLSHILADRGLPNALTTDEVIDRVVRRLGVPRETVCLQERHLAQAAQECLFEKVPAGQRLARLGAILAAPPKIKSPDDAVGVQNELRTHLMKVGKPAYAPETFVDFTSAMQLIRELGGFASYPILADAVSPVCPFENPPEKLAANLRARCVFAAELITGRNSAPAVARYAKAMRTAGLIVTAGTEHNTPEMIPLAPACLHNEPITPEFKALFYEGACVIAAHQFLLSHAEMGYVDASGNLNPRYADDEERIAEFARLGDTVIRRYLNLTRTPPARR
jgi:hypothetical protein